MPSERPVGDPRSDLLQQVLTELRHQLETGQAASAETILSAYPSLADDPTLAVAVILCEFQVRQRLGENPDAAEFLRKHPRYEEVLRQRFEDLELVGTTVADVTARTSDSVEATPTPLVTHIEAPDLPEHELLEKLAEAGMGVVYRA